MEMRHKLSILRDYYYWYSRLKIFKSSDGEALQVHGSSVPQPYQHTLKSLLLDAHSSGAGRPSAFKLCTNLMLVDHST